MVKLGGSLITDKAGGGGIQEAELSRLAQDLVALHGTGDHDLILGHGSGSFGHRAAANAGLDGKRIRSAPPAELAAVRAAAEELHQAVLATLRGAGLPVLSVSAASAGELEDSRFKLNGLPVIGALGNGLVPCLHGDVVPFREGGARIVSTEEIFEALLPALTHQGYRRVLCVWLGRTPGILDPHGLTISEIHRENLGLARRASGPAEGRDVTGGMGHRLEKALSLAEKGVTSYIVDGRDPGILCRVLAGEVCRGTRVGPALEPPRDSGNRAP